MKHHQPYVALTLKVLMLALLAALSFGLHADEKVSTEEMQQVSSAEVEPGADEPSPGGDKAASIPQHHRLSRLENPWAKNLQMMMEAGRQPRELTTGDYVVPVVALLSIFALPPLVIMLLIWLIFRSRMRARQLRAETIARYLDAGRDVPPELLLADGVGGVNSESARHKGMVNTGLGIGLAIFLAIFFGWKAATFALIFVGMGTGQLLSARFSR